MKVTRWICDVCGLLEETIGEEPPEDWAVFAGRERWWLCPAHASHALRYVRFLKTKEAPSYA